MNRRKKVLFLVNIISPHLHDFFENLAQFSGYDFTVAVCAYKEPGQMLDFSCLNSASYKYKILDDAKLVKVPFSSSFFYVGGYSLIEDIILNNYSTIIFKGETSFVGPFYALASKVLRKRAILWEESNLSVTTPVKSLAKTFYINDFLFSGFIASGTRVREFLETINYDISDKIHFGYFPINNEKYRQRYLHLKNKRNFIKKALGINGKRKVILYVGRFVKEKNLFTLIDAVNKVKEKQKNIICLMVGSGSLEGELKKYIIQLGLQDFIRFVPFQRFKKLTCYYSIADVFVLPSENEQWGAVVNEAMNFNLPVVVSDRVGCGDDLVKNNYNGFVFPHADFAKLAECIVKACRNTEKMGACSYEIIKNKDYDQLCKTIIAVS